jgi:hypothetical protein
MQVLHTAIAASNTLGLERVANAAEYTIFTVIIKGKVVPVLN